MTKARIFPNFSVNRKAISRRSLEWCLPAHLKIAAFGSPLRRLADAKRFPEIIPLLEDHPCPAKTMEAARNMARALLCVSFHSSAGTESATTPPPA
jgi:hypothetical protein